MSLITIIKLIEDPMSGPLMGEPGEEKEIKLSFILSKKLENNNNNNNNNKTPLYSSHQRIGRTTINDNSY